MTGTLANMIGILLGGAAGWAMRRGLRPATEGWLKIVLFMLTVYFGLRLTWRHLDGSILAILGQLLLVMMALALGRLTGRWLHLQRGSNALGRYARAKMEAASGRAGAHWTEGFVVCTALYCAAPLAILGPVAEVLGRDPSPLFLKAVIDGLATMGFVKIWGVGVMLSAVAVLAFQGTLTLVLWWMEPWLESGNASAAVCATSGLLVFSVALLILEVRRIEVASYLPSLLWAGLLAFVFGW